MPAGGATRSVCPRAAALRGDFEGDAVSLGPFRDIGHGVLGDDEVEAAKAAHFESPRSRTRGEDDVSSAVERGLPDLRLGDVANRDPFLGQAGHADDGISTVNRPRVSRGVGPTRVPHEVADLAATRPTSVCRTPGRLTRRTTSKAFVRMLTLGTWSFLATVLPLSRKTDIPGRVCARTVAAMRLSAALGKGKQARGRKVGPHAQTGPSSVTLARLEDFGVGTQLERRLSAS